MGQYKRFALPNEPRIFGRKKGISWVALVVYRASIMTDSVSATHCRP